MKRSRRGIKQTDLVVEEEAVKDPNPIEVIIKQELDDDGFSCYYGEFTHVKEEDNLSFLGDDNSNQTVMVKEEAVEHESTDPNKCKLGETPCTETCTASHILMKQIYYKKRKHKKKKEDEIDHFFAAMKGSFRKFSELEQLQAKQQIFDIITNIEVKKFD